MADDNSDNDSKKDKRQLVSDEKARMSETSDDDPRGGDEDE